MQTADPEQTHCLHTECSIKILIKKQQPLKQTRIPRIGCVAWQNKSKTRAFAGDINLP